ncbi:oxidoreductase-like protein [Chaetomium fimeti]|uniref:Oxidoreductase-like protein n=1 Tax=Chaetomium fimeti TaxID=1854472 RepID=A0AAE0LNX0_9PEZI|nr:oxidoreductase-like protein [Chaetomium fimeti]
MRRTFLSTGPSRAVYRAFGGQQSRRTFATPPIKSDTPPSPIEPSKEQAHPVGPFYEAILRTPAPLPQEKPEAPPVTSKTSPAQTPKPTPKPAPEQPKPVQEKPAAPAPTPAAEEKAAPEPAAAEDKKPARRPRKAKQPAGKDETSPSSKAKSVPSSSSSPDTSSPPPPPPPQENQPQPEQEQTPKEEEEARSNDSPQAGSARRVVFGASLAGPAERAERLARVRAESRVVAGVVVPPRPEEPDNCCMSGCVNCVWDRYRDDVEEWAARAAEAERRLAADDAGAQVGVTEDSMEGVERGRVMELGVHDGDVDRGAVGVDDDGGGSVGNWEAGLSSSPPPPPSGRIVKDFWDEELYKNVPVGIREFMKHEKRLKEKHRREGTAGG